MSERHELPELLGRAISTQLERLGVEMRTMKTQLERQIVSVLTKLGERPAEWEELPHAMKRLRKGRLTIMHFMQPGALHVDGKIRYTRRPSKGAQEVYLLHRDDLELIFPSVVS